MVVKAWSQVGSGGRKPEVLVKLVVGECNSRNRVQKSRPVVVIDPAVLLAGFLLLRPLDCNSGVFAYGVDDAAEMVAGGEVVADMHGVLL